MIEDFRTDFGRYRDLGEKALAQIPDAALNALPSGDANSAAMIVRHVSGNLISRFTDFLTTDGEKPDRDRDAVHRALTRSLAHICYHVGQIVLLARMHAGSDWRWLSIPKKKEP